MSCFSIDSILGNLTNTQTPRNLATKKSFSEPATPLPALQQENGVYEPLSTAILTPPLTPLSWTTSPTPPSSQPWTSSTPNPGKAPPSVTSPQLAGSTPRRPHYSPYVRQPSLSKPPNVVGISNAKGTRSSL